MSTALKAIDRIITDDAIAGQIMELTLGEVVFKKKPAYSRPNIKWLFDQVEMWERVCEPGLPRKAGVNAAAINTPEESFF